MEKNEMNLRLLVVEDSIDDYLLICEELRAASYNVESTRVCSPDALRNALAARVWDIIVTDHDLPGFDSTAVHDIVRVHASDTPCVIVSGHIPNTLAIRAMREGVRDFLLKDDLSRLAAVVERELRETRMHADLKQARASVRQLSDYDSLTGLPNRAHLLRKLLIDPRTPRRNNTSLTLMLVDINRFSDTNRSHGMVYGNHLLMQVTERLREAFGRDALIARVGPDRFALSCEIPGDIASERIHAALDEPFLLNHQPIRITCSIGSACFPADAITSEDMFRNAETALAVAKKTGRRSYQRYRSDLHEQAERQHMLEADLLRALHDEQFVVHYQPQVSLGTGKIVGAEALLRWNHPQYGQIPPGEFIPLLEETGLIVAVGDWIVRRVCEDIKTIRSRHLYIPHVAINVSPVQFRQKDFVDRLRRILAAEAVPASSIELEITESIALHHEETTIATLQALRDMGHSIAIDDFGTGYSSLSYLRRYAVDKLKIDQSFVRHSSGHKSEQEIIKAIIQIGKSLGLAIVAEGVETESQAGFLRKYGCEFAQGFLYAAGLESTRFEEFLISRSGISAQESEIANIQA